MIDRYFAAIQIEFMEQKALLDIIITLHRNNLNTLARLKALESVMALTVPTSELSDWNKKIDEQMNRILQHFLEDAENQSQWFAAQLDNRGPDALTGLDVPLE